MDLLRRLRTAGTLLVLNFLIGIGGYKVLGGPQWSLLDCAYMTVITLATIGYGEVHDMGNNPSLRVFTMVLIVTGIGTMGYVFTTLTEFVIDGKLQRLLQGQRMSKGISELRGHTIVLGAGETGVHIIEELVRTRTPFVVVDSAQDRVDRVLQHHEFLHIIDDATDEEVLRRAGVERAGGLMVCMPSDKDNLFVTMSARQMNPTLRIIAKVTDLKVRPKLIRAGADAVVSPQYIGGLRLVSEMLRPTVVGFLDSMMRETEQPHRIEEVWIDPGSGMVGRRLEDLHLHSRHGVLVLALRDASNQTYQYCPEGKVHLGAGMTLVILGDVDQVSAVRAEAAGAAGSDPHSAASAAVRPPMT